MAEPLVVHSRQELIEKSQQLAQALPKSNVYLVDLFCGCGGFSAGADKSKLPILIGVDNCANKLQTYRQNWAVHTQAQRFTFTAHLPAQPLARLGGRVRRKATSATG